MATIRPRAVFVTRETDLARLLARHATREQARFFLETRGQRIEDLERRDAEQQAALRSARAAVPGEWRQAEVHRADLDRFLFGPEDVVIAVGQDGLVANVAKYLDGQPVLGINPSPDLYDGVLVRVPLARLAKLLPAALSGDAPAERRTMVAATLDTGERLLALNEVFVGHRSHQSARYTIEAEGAREDQASSGVIVASGTGATGWARSILGVAGASLPLDPQEPAAAFLVREPFPSRATGTALRYGRLSGAPLAITSRMNDGGVLFADGMEQDYLPFDWGNRATIGRADRALNLIVG
ncbi:NAD(+)/NADH kinase [Sphingomonas jatrophae]|uniref:NAD kinase n=1 Tax=Sphingomonas jatrophae TaxID=1166337 RepID=A0A1I6K2J0_9SPHN|nr:NAD(+)/NADH kinase [Sphingomonas jatrophae]SFR85397.1 NAD kinase [Sphingomonas jatrophae]